MAATTVTGIKLGFSNTQRFPYALSVLACGHLGHCTLRPRILVCTRCGTEHARPDEDYRAIYCCGHSAFHCQPLPNPHAEADRVTKPGDVVECRECDRDAEQTAYLRALDRSTLHHTRYRNGFIYLYRLDPTSPSGFMLVRSVSATPEHEALLTGSLSPLSPTERA